MEKLLEKAQNEFEEYDSNEASPTPRPKKRQPEPET